MKCKKELSKEPTMSEVLVRIKENYGEEVFKEGSKLLGMFRDLAPKLKNERTILEIAVMKHIERYFIGVEKSDQQISINKLKNDFEYFMSEKAIDMLIGAFSEAFGWETNETINSIVDVADKLYYAKKYKEAADLYLKASEMGDAKSQNCLGLMYSDGEGVKQNKEEAVKWFRKSAEQGDIKAQCNLGYMYFKGEGIRQNKEEAVKWFRKSAEQDYKISQCNLGYMYFKGEGINQNTEEAVKWFKKSADQGYEKATKMLEKILNQTNNTVKKFNIGDTFEFGNYNNKPIKWKVLKKDKDSIYVISCESLCKREFRKDWNAADANQWEKSHLRKWLNREFYYVAFSKEEKNMIKLTESDKVTLLTKDEAETLMTREERKRIRCWWLRSPYPDYSHDVWSVYSDGAINGNNSADYSGGVCPALHLKF